MNAPGARRLFFALWPAADVRGELAARARDARADLPGRAIPDENLHLTLAFLGKVPLDRISGVREAASTVVGEPFALSLERRGWFRRAEILMLAPAATPPALMALAENLAEALQPLGFSIDFRRFRPHVTIARRCDRGAAGEVSPVHWPVDGFALVASELDHHGARYRVLRDWPLIPA